MLLFFQPLGASLPPLKGEGALAQLGHSLGAGPSVGGSLGTGPVGGGSLGKSLPRERSLGSFLEKSSSNGSLNTGSKPGLGSSGGRFPTAMQQKDPFQQSPLGSIKDPSGVSMLKKKKENVVYSFSLLW